MDRIKEEKQVLVGTDYRTTDKEWIRARTKLSGLQVIYIFSSTLTNTCSMVPRPVPE